ncbi:chorismate mutase/prephenate dehydratase [Blastomyces dermatitidis ATCC 18188]|uniref:prephenate dehydratase n=1 Tax=Ajellomyces dermatitidis (strain ATCC 18188 / CBS 674.68) TaxID=653446 RepID=F2TP07_AJEDA|nr:chorismate mutase/prephenate dehydratase [Blastomyces dermatitidis ATCC 18188]
MRSGVTISTNYGRRLCNFQLIPVLFHSKGTLSGQHSINGDKLQHCAMSASPHKELRVTFLGPLASFSHQAALDLFPTSTTTTTSTTRTVTLLPKPSFADAFAAIQSTEADYAVIPFENSTNGSVVQTLDLLADRDGRYHDIVVCGEYYLTVHHCLLVRNEDAASDPETIYPRISKLYTHPQAWGQCEVFLSKHFRGIERKDTPSTSRAASIVAKYGSTTAPIPTPTPGTGGNGGGDNATGNDSEGIPAAIASSFAATHHNLSILAANIEDRADNTTRFLVLRNRNSERTREGEGEGGDFYPTATATSSTDTTTTTVAPPTKLKSLISFMINHETPGALVDALTIFRRHGLNLTSIVSRPGQIRPWQYIFFVECERVRGVHEEDVVEKAMEELEGKTSCCRDLGSWEGRLG